MPATPFVEEHIEAEQLAARIRRLQRENAILREDQSPAAGPLELQAENILLRREAEVLRDELGRFAPHTGPLPKTLEAFRGLPEAHRRQLLRDHGEELRRLREVDALLREAQRCGEGDARRRAALGGAAVASLDELAALPAKQRRRVVLEMTPRQRRALLGLPDGEGRGAGYL